MIDRYVIIYLLLSIILIFLLSWEIEQGFHAPEWDVSEQTQTMKLPFQEIIGFMVFGITVILACFSVFGFSFLLIYGDE